MYIFRLYSVKLNFNGYKGLIRLQAFIREFLEMTSSLRYQHKRFDGSTRFMEKFLVFTSASYWHNFQCLATTSP